MNNKPILPTLILAQKLISKQFPEYADLSITEVDKQGHDNRTYRQIILIHSLSINGYPEKA